jgi:hypothetical protein
MALFFLISYNLIGCKKEDTVIVSDPMAVKSSLLVAPSSTRQSWHLSSYLVQNISQTLSYAQKQYSIKYFDNATFITSDGTTGTWKFTDISSLTETYKSSVFGGGFVQTSSIDTISATILKLRYTYNGSNITTIYTVGY